MHFVTIFVQGQVGFKFTMLDIGGGFPGDSFAAITFEEVSCQVKLKLKCVKNACVPWLLIA